MKLRLLLLACILTLGLFATSFGEEAADTTGAWKKQLDLGLNVTQSSYSDSWTGG